VVTIGFDLEILNFSSPEKDVRNAICVDDQLALFHCRYIYIRAYVALNIFKRMQRIIFIIIIIIITQNTFFGVNPIRACVKKTYRLGVFERKERVMDQFGLHKSVYALYSFAYIIVTLCIYTYMCEYNTWRYQICHIRVHTSIWDIMQNTMGKKRKVTWRL
jgi:hypothetical protein